MMPELSIELKEQTVAALVKVLFELDVTSSLFKDGRVTIKEMLRESLVHFGASEEDAERCRQWVYQSSKKWGQSVIDAGDWKGDGR